jgi:hypothetical protein
MNERDPKSKCFVCGKRYLGRLTNGNIMDSKDSPLLQAVGTVIRDRMMEAVGEITGEADFCSSYCIERWINRKENKAKLVLEISR